MWSRFLREEVFRFSEGSSGRPGCFVSDSNAEGLRISTISADPWHLAVEEVSASGICFELLARV